MNSLGETDRPEPVCPGDLGVTPKPTDEELRILRDEVDPEGLVIGRR
jgi:hypothetical protein